MESQNQLSKLGENSLQDLQSISESIKNYVDRENDVVLQTVVEKIKTNENMLQKLLPNKTTRVYKKMLTEKMYNVFKSQEHMFEIYTEIQIEIARQQGDALIAATGMQLRDSLSKFANQKINSLKNTLEESREGYMESISRQLDNAERYKKHKELYEDLKESIRFEWKQYFGFVENLIVGFREALNSKVSELNK